MLKLIRSFLEEDSRYFSECKMNIAERNNRMLKRGCVLYAFVLCFYTVLTTVTDHPQILRVMYYVFDAIHICLCGVVFSGDKWREKSLPATQIVCACLEASILGFFALEGVFVSKTEHSLYIPIAILLVLLLFIHKAAYAFTITGAYVLTFAALSYFYKTPAARLNDIYIAAATLISSNIGYYLIARMRHSEGRALVKYEKLSRTDQLTGMFNKTSITQICERILKDKGRECSFIFIDLDDFKSVNDIYGHDVGDEVLRAVSCKIKSDFRGTDFVGRFGGDEFVVLMDNCGDEEIIKDRVEKLLCGIRKLTFSDERLKIHCSAGITLKREDDTVQTILKRADNALYQAKHEGKGYYCIY